MSFDLRLVRLYPMTPAEAAALYARAAATGSFVMWFITLTDPVYPGQAVAYAMQASNSGGERLPGDLWRARSRRCARCYRQV